jgi:hypothetical protein
MFVWVCCFFALVENLSRRINAVTGFSNGAEHMKKVLVTICSLILAFGVAGCVGKAPVGKGKAPVVQTRG